MGELLAQRLEGLQARDDDVPVAHGGDELRESALSRLIVGAAVVDAQLLGGVRVVEHDHLLVADHSHPARLHGVEPAHVHAREHLAGVAEGHEDHILGACLEVRLPACDQVYWIGTEPVAKHRQVVRGQVPQCVHVLADGAEAGTLEVEVADLPEQTLVDVRLDRAHRRVEEECVADHEGVA